MNVIQRLSILLIGRTTGYSEVELRTTTWSIGRILGDVAGLGSINELVAINFRIVATPKLKLGRRHRPCRLGPVSFDNLRFCGHLGWHVSDGHEP
jgi:hypothetical protein